MLTLSISAIILLLLLGTQSLGRQLFTQNDQFIIRTLRLESDGRQATPARLREWANVQEGMNIFTVDIDSIQHLLVSRVPIIEKAVVRRELPDTLVIQVTERQALAQLDKRGNYIPLALDREGYVLGPSSRTPNLPVISGVRQAGLRPGSYLDTVEVRHALDVLNTCDTTRLGKYLDIREIKLNNPDFMELELGMGARVLLAPDDVGQRLRKVVALLQTSAQKGVVPLVIDATGSNNYPVQYR
ncbi:MAG: FtsQ-type POTRA domain-containing protein [Kiritimatiellae bacterium]|nr:FtsQ-type POTRA domain-containing protein [Kiritimatiellia bacterium]